MKFLLPLLASALLLSGCERPPIDSVQHGYRGTGMVQVYNPRTLEAQAANNDVPMALPAAGNEGPKAGQLYKNVKVLGDLSAGQFTRLMVSMSRPYDITSIPRRPFRVTFLSSGRTSPVASLLIRPSR